MGEDSFCFFETRKLLVLKIGIGIGIGIGIDGFEVDW